MTHAALLLIALVLDAIFGEPDWLWAKVQHPVKLAGIAIGRLDEHFNHGQGRKQKGVLVCAILVIAAGLSGKLIALIPDYGLLECLGAAVLIAHRSLVDHVTDVASELDKGLDPGRKALSRIVGRDVAALDESDISRAAIESAAENFSDGVIAPAFWFLIFGLPGIMIYKAVNTADSMIGHMNERYRDFGWGAAKLDDLLNWIPARLTAVLVCSIYRSSEAWEIVAEDADLHRSPNAGWPEAAFAGVLGIALSGPRSYDGELSRDPWLNGSGRRDLRRSDILAAVAVMQRSWAAVILGLAGITLLLGLL